MMSSIEDETDENMTADNVIGGAVTAARVGADMRAARDRLGWELPAVAAHLRIRLPFLQAIEDGRIRDLPGNAYAVGFVRTYAQALGLAPDEIARRFRAEAADVNRKTELDFPAPVPERGVPAGAVVLLGVVLAVGAYIGWYRMTGSDAPSETPIAAVPPRLEKMEAALTPPPAPAPASTATSTAPGVDPQGDAGPQLSPGSAAAAIPLPGATLNSPAVSALPAPATAIASAAPPPAVSASPDGGRIMLRAKADAWIQVRDRNGPVLLNRVMRSGETWPVPGTGQLLLTTGNAGGTELVVDGVTAPSLGNDGAVRRDLPLDPDQIKDGKLAAAAPSPPKPVIHAAVPPQG